MNLIKLTISLSCLIALAAPVKSETSVEQDYGYANGWVISTCLLYATGSIDHSTFTDQVKLAAEFKKTTRRVRRSILSNFEKHTEPSSKLMVCLPVIRSYMGT